MKVDKVWEAVLQNFLDLRALLETPGVWIQGREAECDEKIACDAEDETACHFCLLGGIDRVTYLSLGAWTEESLRGVVLEVMREFIRRDLDLPPGTSIAKWNDDPDRTLSEVLAMLDRTIARVRETD